MYRAVHIAKNLKGDRGIWAIVACLLLASVLAVYSSTGTIAFKYNGGHAEIVYTSSVYKWGNDQGVNVIEDEDDWKKK